VKQVASSNLIDLMHLLLIAGNDDQARVAADRYVESVKDSIHRRWVLYDIDTTYLQARPMRLAAAEMITARLDSLGRAGALQRSMVHWLLLLDAQERWDVERYRHEALALLLIDSQLSDEDRTDREVELGGGGFTSLLAAELYQTPQDVSGAFDRVVRTAQSAGYQDIATLRTWLEGQPELQWMFAQHGRLVPTLQADYWTGIDSTARTWPVRGKVSIIANLREWQLTNPAWASSWRRIARKYGKAVNITFMYKTAGYIGDSPPLTPSQEVARISKLILDDLQLPVTLAIDTPSVQRLPDGRIQRGEVAFEQSRYYRGGFIITDSAGKILFMIQPNEHALEALIDRALVRYPGTGRDARKSKDAVHP
jgi:hypothetical protein